MTAQAVKDAHPVHVYWDYVECECGWVGAAPTPEEAKQMARMHWAFVEGLR